MTKKLLPYHFKECGLDYVYLTNGYNIDKYDNITIFKADKLHRAIAAELFFTRGRSAQNVRFLNSVSKRLDIALAKELYYRDYTISQHLPDRDQGNLIMTLDVCGQWKAKWSKLGEEEKSLFKKLKEWMFPNRK